MTDTIIEIDESDLKYLDEATYNEYFPLFTQLKALLASQSIKYIQFQVEYHGSGDSGDNEKATLTFTDAEGTEVMTSGGSHNARDHLPASLCEELEDFLMGKVDYDWYNNDGGAGTAFINLSDGQFGYEGCFNETVTTDVASGYNISDRR